MEWNFLFSGVLVLAALAYAAREKLGVEKSLAVNSLRAFVQLLALGYVLVYVFAIENPLGLAGVLGLMLLFAAWTGAKRVKLGKGGFPVALASIGVASTLVFTTLLAVGAIQTDPHEMIPVGGMVIGNALNVYALAVDRMKGEVKNTLGAIEARTALGADLYEALHPPVRHSVKSAMIPVLNNLQTVGIVFIPGVMTGMLMAGAEPLKAVSYQLVVMYMMVAVATFTAAFTAFFARKRLLGTV